jgi:hypothetical protein
MQKAVELTLLSHRYHIWVYETSLHIILQGPPPRVNDTYWTMLHWSFVHRSWPKQLNDARVLIYDHLPEGLFLRIKVWRHGLSGRVPAYQAWGPEFKPPRKKQQENFKSNTNGVNLIKAQYMYVCHTYEIKCHTYKYHNEPPLYN